MLFVLFQLGNDRYALDSGQIVEIVPLVDIKKMPRSPRGIAGIFNYRGQSVPVIDLDEMVFDHPAPRRLSTRIIVVLVPDGAGGKRSLGLIAECATGTMRRDASEFVPSGMSSDTASYLGPVAIDPLGIIQWIEVDKLLSAQVRDSLFKNPAES
jgi:chemotaxis-related protein WspB